MPCVVLYCGCMSLDSEPAVGDPAEVGHVFDDDPFRGVDDDFLAEAGFGGC